MLSVFKGGEGRGGGIKLSSLKYGSPEATKLNEIASRDVPLMKVIRIPA